MISNVQSDLVVTAEFVEVVVVEYTVEFLAGLNGSISGTSVQTIEFGLSTESVEAVADSGYVFSQWSDGNTENPRVISNVQSDLVLTAEFVEVVVVEYTVEFVAGLNGSINGTSVQTIESGLSTESVEAVADSGYVFSQWSDGNTDNPRVISNIQSDLVLTAEFVEETP